MRIIEALGSFREASSKGLLWFYVRFEGSQQRQLVEKLLYLFKLSLESSE
jgi:hypothetical protein